MKQQVRQQAAEDASRYEAGGAHRDELEREVVIGVRGIRSTHLERVATAAAAAAPEALCTQLTDCTLEQ